jgi:2-methylcitrate dehydratase PrpD
MEQRRTYRGGQTLTTLERADVRRLRNVIEIVRDADMDRRSPSTRAAWVEIETIDGRTVKAPEQLAPGHWELGGAPWPDVEEKFTALVERRLGSKASTRIIELVHNLESQAELSQLGAALSGPSKEQPHAH